MRIGINPEKHNNQLSIEHYHRVVIPVYIPNLEDNYFKDALVILKLCFSSLLATIHNKTKISIINNGSCNAVSAYLDELYRNNDSIDQLLYSKINLGKVNALYSVIKSNLEPLITISDADVMFLPNWQEAVEKIFINFPEAGMISPVPSSLAYRSKFINSTVYYGIIKGKIRFERVVSQEGLIKFEKSIGRKMYDDIHLEKYLTISNVKSTAVIGCGHFVATLRSEVFKSSPPEVSAHKIVGGSENLYFDIPNDKAGFLRLATKDNYAYHLGNIFEPWMKDKINHILKQSKSKSLDIELPKGKPISKVQYNLGKLLYILLFKKFKSLYFRLKGVKVPY